MAAFVQPRWAYPLYNLNDYTAFVLPSDPASTPTDDVTALSEDVDAMRLYNESKLILRDVSASKNNPPIKHHPSQDLVTALHLGAHVNQYFRPYVDVVHPEDTIRSDAPAAVSTETKPKIRSSVPPPPTTTAPARKANPYAKYWDRPVGSTHGESKTTTKDDLADSPAGPSRMVTKPKVECITKTKPKPIIKTSSISGTDGTAGAGQKRTASGAGLGGPGEDRSAEGNAAQRAGQKKKRTIESGMPKIDKGYTHLIPDCIDPLPTGDDKDSNRIFRDLLADLLHPPLPGTAAPPPPDWSGRGVEHLSLDFFMQRAKIPAGIVVEGYKPGSKDGVEQSENARRNKRNKRDRLLQNALERFSSPHTASSPAPASPATPGPPIPPPRPAFLQGVHQRNFSMDSRPSYAAQSPGYGKTPKAHPNRPGPYDRPPASAGRTPGTPRLQGGPGQAGHKHRSATQPPPGRQPGTPLSAGLPPRPAGTPVPLGQHERRLSGTKRPAEDAMRGEKMKKPKGVNGGSRSASPMPRQQGGPALAQGQGQQVAPGTPRQYPGQPGKFARSGTAGT